MTVEDLSPTMQRAYFTEYGRWQMNSSSIVTVIKKVKDGATVQFSVRTLECTGSLYHLAKIKIRTDGTVTRVKWDKQNTYELPTRMVTV